MNVWVSIIYETAGYTDSSRLYGFEFFAANTVGCPVIREDRFPADNPRTNVETNDSIIFYPESDSYIFHYSASCIL